MEVLEGREVNNRRARISELAKGAGSVPKGIEVGIDESRWIKPQYPPIRIRVVEIIREIRGADQVRPVGQTVVGAAHDERRAGRNRRDRVDLPSAEGGVQQSLLKIPPLALADRQFKQSAQDEAVWHVRRVFGALGAAVVQAVLIAVFIAAL